MSGPSGQDWNRVVIKPKGGGGGGKKAAPGAGGAATEKKCECVSLLSSLSSSMFVFVLLYADACFRFFFAIVDAAVSSHCGEQLWERR